MKLAQASQTRRSTTHKSAPRSTAKPHILDDAAALAVHLIGDRLADAHEAVRSAIDSLSLSTYEGDSGHRRRARQRVLEAWQCLAGVARDLAVPPPRFRANATGPRPIVRKSRDTWIEPEVADLRPACLHVVMDGLRSAGVS